MKSIKVGREPGKNDIVVNDSMVSRMHCEFIMDDYGNYRVVDLNSSNGTFVNGVRRQGDTKINPTDTVKIGNTILPWMNYFNGAPSNLSPVRTNIMPNPQPVVTPAPQGGKGLSIAAMVCGIVGMFLFGFVLGILATVFGAIALAKHKPGRGMAITGMVLGIVALVGNILIWVAVGSLGLGLLSMLGS